MAKDSTPAQLHIKIDGANFPQMHAVTLALLGELMVDVRVLSAKVGAILAGMPESEYSEQQVDARYEAMDDVASEAYQEATKLVQEKIDNLVKRIMQPA